MEHILSLRKAEAVEQAAKNRSSKKGKTRTVTTELLLNTNRHTSDARAHNLGVIAFLTSLKNHWCRLALSNCITSSPNFIQARLV